MEQNRLDELVQHISIFQKGCEKYLSPICKPEGKRVLVVGSGWGTEIAWLLGKGAKEIVGVDPAPRDTAPLDQFIAQQSLSGGYSVLKASVEDIVSDYQGYFDLIVSHNVFEHIMDLDSVFSTLPDVLAEQGRVAIFADPLFYSSCGAHMKVEPWEHLWGDLQAIKARVPSYQWHDYKHGLNKMTVTSFLEAIKRSGASLLQLSIVPDRNLREFHKYKELILLRYPIESLDLTTEGVGVELVYS